ncbi:MAG: hypothetical protein WDM90_21145 [Ferruginibacter sp.]
MRLLICTLYFPPCTFTPANRTFSWAKYLNKSGIYPIIITRQWPAKNITEHYFEQAAGKDVIIEKHENYEVHFLPFSGNIRTRSTGKKLNLLAKLGVKAFVATEMLFRYFFSSLLPYQNLFSYTLEYISKNKIDKLLISGSPFMLFKIGYLANKKFNIPWIADYRDGWTTDNYREETGVLTRPVHTLNRYFEKKWVATATAFTTVSEFLKQGIEKYTGKEGHVVYNGFFSDGNLPVLPRPDKSRITFLYSGIVYEKQDYNTPVTVFKKLIDAYKGQIDIKLIFLGTVYANLKFANDPVFENYRDSFLLMERVDYEAALKIHEAADVFLMLSHKGMKGIASSKIFDYIKYYKPVVLFTNDHDVLEEILVKSNIGTIADDAIELEQKLNAMLQDKLANGTIAQKPDIAYISLFSRENQAALLAKIIHK